MVLLVLIALAARVDASPADDARPSTNDGVAEAIRYANILTGDDPDALSASDLDEADDDEGDDEGDDERDDDGDESDADARDNDNDDDTPRELALDDGGETERSTTLEELSSDLAGGALAGHIAGELAWLDAGTADAGAAGGDDVSFAAASAGAAETYEVWMRHQRPSPWGRLDVGIAWRQRWSEPMSGMSRRYDEVWLVATWRR